MHQQAVICMKVAAQSRQIKACCMTACNIASALAQTMLNKAKTQGANLSATLWLTSIACAEAIWNRSAYDTPSYLSAMLFSSSTATGKPTKERTCEMLQLVYVAQD